MKSDNNVIPFKSLRKVKEKQEAEEKLNNTASVTDISNLRQEAIQSERRKVKRTILTEFIGANVVVPGQGLLKIKLYDISEDGIAFDMEEESGHFSQGEEVAVRVYMNHKTYFPFTVEVTYALQKPDKGVYRIGAKFVRDTLNKEALFHFVKFIENVSASLRSDKGDIMVSNIK